MEYKKFVEEFDLSQIWLREPQIRGKWCSKIRLRKRVKISKQMWKDTTGIEQEVDNVQLPQLQTIYSLSNKIIR